MKKNILGILGLLIAIFVVTALLNPKFISAYNMQNLIKWHYWPMSEEQYRQAIEEVDAAP